jgi:hypothetical protein
MIHYLIAPDSPLYPVRTSSDLFRTLPREVLIHAFSSG